MENVGGWVSCIIHCRETLKLDIKMNVLPCYELANCVCNNLVCQLMRHAKGLPFRVSMRHHVG